MRYLKSLTLPLLATPALCAALLPLARAQESAAPLADEAPVCIMEYQGQVVTFGSIMVPITPGFTSVDLSACSSYDPEGFPLKFQWIGCALGTFSDDKACNPTWVVATQPTPFSCDVRCILTDVAGNNTALGCRLDVNFFENTPPTCNVAQPVIQVQASGNSVTVDLDACASSDPDVFQTLSYKWTGCPGSTFSDDSACATQMTIDITGKTLPYDCIAVVNVTDGVPGSFSQCTVKVTVEPPPDMDFCPGGCPNFVRANAPGTVRTVLIGAPLFDVSAVDKTSVRVQRADGQGLAYAPRTFGVFDTSTPDKFQSAPCDCQGTSPDGIKDLLMVIDMPTFSSNLGLVGEVAGTTLQIDMVGKLVTGEDFKVSDCIVVQ